MPFLDPNGLTRLWQHTLAAIANKANSTDLANYLSLDGGTITGELTTDTVKSKSITPVSTNAYNLGSASSAWSSVYADNVYGDLQGNASTASALTENAGSENQPIYFKDGIPAIIGYTIEKSVPSDAKFTDTTYNVATTTSDGLMSATDKQKLQNLEQGIVEYNLPVATVNKLGGIKAGTDISVDEEGNVSINDNSHNHTIDNISNLQTTLDTKIPLSYKGAANGVAELDSSGKVPESQLPSYVDDVLEYTNRDNFPSNGESGKIYVDISTNLTYRWSGSTYVNIASALALGETESTAYRGDRGAAAYLHAQNKGSTAYNSGLYKVTVNNHGHITAATPVVKADITALGIPGSIGEYGTATQTDNGLMSADDKKKLDGIAEYANNYTYTLPTAGSTLGGVKTTSTVSSTSGLTACPIISGVPYYKDTNTTYTVATTSQNGLLSSTDKVKLDGIAENANNYIHPTTAGNKHIPSGGSSGQILRWSNDGIAIWDAEFNSVATQSANGLLSATDKTKLDGIATGANNYTHPTTTGNKHIPSGGQSGQILRWGDDGVAVWGADNNTIYSAATTSANGLMTAAMVTKLNGIAENANNYTLPTASSTLGGVKTTSTVTSTSGLTACPIISGVPYYKDTNTTYTLNSFGITATAAELNALDGITATVTELNYCDGVTSNIQTQLNGKAASSHTHSYLPLTGGIITGNLVVNGTITGAVYA